ncbi:ABC transporter permease [Amorphus orientalis]|uniref:NitT/TauT family transport system permease protein n=1 Tax=Amorphus orientalis TaxID=649198 RepID=A0AAE4AU86_9HYPH|nr:ABC transporter permease subunit [Amorphus orientalis]MDQ0316857.1 NitT/TauT family transport system permease protein [Amorphus orientalis]
MAGRLPILLSLLTWAILWELATRIAGSTMFPPLSTILLTVGDVVQLKSFQTALVVTARAFVIGMALALVVGIPVGALMGRFSAADKILNVWVNIFISAPLTAVVPALMPLLGIGETTVVATVFLFAVWVIIIDTREGIQGVSPSLVEMARSNGATRFQMFWKILLPSAMPEVMTGVRLGVVRGVKGVIIGQIVIALVGFGALFETYLQTFQMTRFWALVLVVFSLGFVLVELVGLLEKRLTFHAKSR